MMKYLLMLLVISCSSPSPEELAYKDRILQLNCREKDTTCLDRLEEYCSGAVLQSETKENGTVTRIYICPRK